MKTQCYALIVDKFLYTEIPHCSEHVLLICFSNQVWKEILICNFFHSMDLLHYFALSFTLHRKKELF